MAPQGSAIAQIGAAITGAAAPAWKESGPPPHAPNSHDRDTSDHLEGRSRLRFQEVEMTGLTLHSIVVFRHAED